MLILLPFFILSLAALVITVLQRVRPGYGYPWMVAVSFSLVSWILILVLHWQNVSGFSLDSWQPIDEPGSALIFQLDSVSWPYALSVVSLLLAVVATASARELTHTTPTAWVGSLALTGTSLLAILAKTPLTLILTWTMVDLIELVILLRIVNQPTQTQRVAFAFAVRVAGTLFAVWAILISLGRGVALTLDHVIPEVGLFLLLASGLRLGVIPANLPFAREVNIPKGLGTVLRLAAPASSLPLLARLPATVVPPDLARVLLVFTALAGLYGSGMWLAARDEKEGSPFWVIALAGMAVASSIRGHPEASLAWGIALILSGGLIFLFSARTRWILVIPLIGWLGFSGLPFTPAASGWRGLVVLPFTLLDIIFLAVLVLLQIGFLRHIQNPGEDLKAKDRWIQAVYPVGLSILNISYWLIGVTGWPGSFSAGLWWASAISTILLVLGSVLGYQIGSGRVKQGSRVQWLLILTRRVVATLGEVFSLNWMYRLFWRVYGEMERMIGFITIILEGDGGMLWALLLLVIFISLFRQKGLP